MRLVDISHVLKKDMPVFPGDEPVRLTPLKNYMNDNYTAYFLQTGLHAGTHLDMPGHMLDDARTVADFPPERFIERGVLLDMRGESVLKMKPAYESHIREGDIVLLYTGWDVRFHEPDYFRDYPVVDDTLADFLIGKKIKILGMDTPSPDRAPYALHKKLLSQDIFILENLTNLHQLLSVPAFEVVALPLKLAAEASPVRAVCRIP
ncbi:MAG: cyclase family protein [Clostridia bacterium]|jgi:kynurenine formamidase|nr:cyclase family protein [Clostridia bacterium]